MQYKPMQKFEIGLKTADNLCTDLLPELNAKLPRENYEAGPRPNIFMVGLLTRFVQTLWKSNPPRPGAWPTIARFCVGSGRLVRAGTFADGGLLGLGRYP